MSLQYLLYLLSNLALALALCYAPDGSLSPGDGYLPCVTTLDVNSMCCVLNVTALELIGKTVANIDTCQPDGLCLNGGQSSRNFCTDKTWKSPNCLNVCAGGSDGGTASTFSIMTHCADGSWCCGTGNLTDCCNVNLGFQLAASIPPYAASATPTTSATSVVATSSAASSSTPSSSPSTTAASTSTPGSSPSTTNSNLGTTSTPAPTSNPASTLNTLGIGLGVALGAVVLIAAVIGVVLYRRNRRRRPVSDHVIVKAPYTFQQRPSHYGSKTELEQPHVVHEVPERREPVELHGWSGRI